MSESTFPLIEAVIKMRPVMFYPAIAQVIGIKEAIFCSQILYWTPRARNEEGWVYKSAEDIEAETALGYREQQRIRAKLVEIGILEERYVRSEHRLYFRINRAFMDKMISEVIAQKVGTPDETSHAVLVEHLPKSQGAPDEMSDEHLTERKVAPDEMSVRVPYSTQETTSKEYAPTPGLKIQRGGDPVLAAFQIYRQLYNQHLATEPMLRKSEEAKLKEIAKAKGMDVVRLLELFFETETRDYTVWQFERSLRGLEHAAAAGKEPDYSPDFERFWAAYPKQVKKPRAWKVWLAVKPTDDDVEKMLKTLEWQRTRGEWTRERGEYIPEPASWLENRQWKDKIDDLSVPVKRNFKTDPSERRHDLD